MIMVISLRKHMDAHGDQLAETAVSAYRTALSAMAKAVAQALPPLANDFAEKLNQLQENLSSNVTPEAMARIQHAVETELAEWGNSAAQYSFEKAREIREIMVAVTASALALGERDNRYKTHFGGLTTRLQTVAGLEDLSSIRVSVMESAKDLKAAVQQMISEGEQSILQLRAEVENYRAKLEQAERREAVDPLTGLSSRREIEARLDERILWKRSFSIAIVDLNGFKRINDSFGHVAGDDLLKQFGEELRGQFRADDVVGRWGGDEFIIVLDLNLEHTRAFLDRVRKWVFGRYKINTGRDLIEVEVKAAMGVAAWDGAESALELLARADQNMYADKRSEKITMKMVG